MPFLLATRGAAPIAIARKRRSSAPFDKYAFCVYTVSLESTRRNACRFPAEAGRTAGKTTSNGIERESQREQMPACAALSGDGIGLVFIEHPDRLLEGVPPEGIAQLRGH